MKEFAPFVERWRHRVRFITPIMEDFVATVVGLSFGGHVKFRRCQKWFANLVRFEQHPTTSMTFHILPEVRVASDFKKV